MTQIVSAERAARPAMVIPIVNFDNNQHAANENVRFGNLFRGVVIYAAILRM